MAQTNKCALVVTDGLETKTLPSRFEEGRSTLLEYVLDSVWTVADDIIVAFSQEPSLSLIEKIAPFGVKVVVDRNGGSELSRIVTGFRATTSDNCLVVRASSPFVKPNVLFQLFESVHGYDAAVPSWGRGKKEALLSVYGRKSFLKAASQAKRRSMNGLIDELYAVCYVDVERSLRPLDPDLDSFFSIKDRSDLVRARRMAATKAPR